ncbi:Hypothetical predicted protein [Octopus vulgaris]|uniref:Uncharacterized protein n=1 Tax=Octopus vulgaris TaxID=6645 RepID=A0AA36BKH1_OCTVU|nr:Hypothetical predicted protein [Octopus vulgaris]
MKENSKYTPAQIDELVTTDGGVPSPNIANSYAFLLLIVIPMFEREEKSILMRIILYQNCFTNNFLQCRVYFREAYKKNCKRFVTSEFCTESAEKLCPLALEKYPIKKPDSNEDKIWVQWSQSRNLKYVINFNVSNIFDSIAVLAFKFTGQYEENLMPETKLQSNKVLR